jgi:hypothetical protein
LTVAEEVLVLVGVILALVAAAAEAADGEVAAEGVEKFHPITP